MPRVLLTGFEPFQQWRENSSWEAVRYLASRRRGVTARLLPVDHTAAAEAVLDHVARMDPEVLLLTGLAPDLVPRLERVGRAGVLVPQGGPVARIGRWYWSSALRRVRSRGLPVRTSWDAGNFVCDTTYWVALGTKVPKVAFLHLPPVGPVWTPRRAARTVESVLLAEIRACSVRQLYPRTRT